MKKLVHRLAGLCVVASSLVAALPAQAAYVTTVSCQDSVATRSRALNPGYRACFGPTEGMLSGSQSELDNLQALFSGIVTGSFVFKGKSTDSGNGPFRNNPNSVLGTLLFDTTLFGPFVLGLEGDNNYSFYLFDVRTTGAASRQFDTLGITNSDGSLAGPLLAFASLYVLDVPSGGVVPEPAGLGLLAAAFGALALTTRRRRG